MSSYFQFDPFEMDISIEKNIDKFSIYYDEYFIVFKNIHDVIEMRIGKYLEDVQSLINKLQDRLDEEINRVKKNKE